MAIISPLRYNLAISVQKVLQPQAYKPDMLSKIQVSSNHWNILSINPTLNLHEIASLNMCSYEKICYAFQNKTKKKNRRNMRNAWYVLLINFEKF